MPPPQPLFCGLSRLCRKRVAANLALRDALARWVTGVLARCARALRDRRNDDHSDDAERADQDDGAHRPPLGRRRPGWAFERGLRPAWPLPGRPLNGPPRIPPFGIRTRRPEPGGIEAPGPDRRRLRTRARPRGCATPRRIRG